VAESADAVVDAAAAVIDARPDTQFLPVLRRANVRGALDMGMAPGVLPGRVALEDARDWYESRWAKVPATRGLDTEGILRAAADGRIDVLVLLGADPLSDFPDQDLAARALTGARTVISIDTILNASSRRADVVLAAAGFAEKAGTTTNIEGRVNTVSQRVTPPGTARADWMLATEIASRLGTEFGFSSPQDILDEIGSIAPAYLGLSIEALAASPDGIVLPLDLPVEEIVEETVEAVIDDVVAEIETEAGEPVDDFVDVLAMVDDDEFVAGSTPRLVSFVSDAPLPVPPLDSYAFRLIATRKLYDQGTIVQSAGSLAPLAPGTSLLVNPWDLDRLGVAESGRVTVRSSRASLTLSIASDPGVPRGAAALVMSQADVRVGELIDVGDPVTEIRIETA
jgi:NADH-quinone oxidoreductase subunit G